MQEVPQGVGAFGIVFEQELVGFGQCSPEHVIELGSQPSQIVFRRMQFIKQFSVPNVRFNFANMALKQLASVANYQSLENNPPEPAQQPKIQPISHCQRHDCQEDYLIHLLDQQTKLIELMAQELTDLRIISIQEKQQLWRRIQLLEKQAKTRGIELAKLERYHEGRMKRFQQEIEDLEDMLREKDKENEALWAGKEMLRRPLIKYESDGEDEICADDNDQEMEPQWDDQSLNLTKGSQFVVVEGEEDEDLINTSNNPPSSMLRSVTQPNAPTSGKKTKKNPDPMLSSVKNQRQSGSFDLPQSIGLGGVGKKIDALF